MIFRLPTLRRRDPAKHARRSIALCPEGGYFLLVLAFVLGGAVLREINLLVVLSGMMLGPLLLSIRLALATLRKLQVERQMPEVICAGDLLVVGLRATNNRKRLDSWGLLVEDRIHREGDSGRKNDILASVLLPHLKAGESDRIAYQGRLTRRGRYKFGPLRASTRFPLGLVKGSVTLPQTRELLVYPRPGRLLPSWQKALETELLGTQRSQRRHGHLEGDFFGLRGWRTGDSQRWIHWRSTAKRGNVTVRQFERQRGQDLRLIVELWLPEEPTPRQRENVELAVSFVATIVSERCRHGSSHLHLAIAGREPATVEGAASMVLQQEAMEALAVAESTSEDVLPGVLDRALDKKLRGRTVIVSTRPADLADTDRFRQTWDDPRHRRSLREVLCVDASGAEIEEYFQID